MDMREVDACHTLAQRDTTRSLGRPPDKDLRAGVFFGGLQGRMRALTNAQLRGLVLFLGSWLRPDSAMIVHTMAASGRRVSFRFLFL